VRETERLNRERGQQHKEFMDSVTRKSAEIHSAAQHYPSAPPAAGTGSMASTAIGQRAGQRWRRWIQELLRGLLQSLPSRPPPPVGRTKPSEIQTGMVKDAVLEKRGALHSKVSIPEDGILVETLTYPRRQCTRQGQD
jgi:hypothetical protein